jgi:hypothetical protein
VAAPSARGAEGRFPPIRSAATRLRKLLIVLDLCYDLAEAVFRREPERLRDLEPPEDDGPLPRLRFEPVERPLLDPVERPLLEPVERPFADAPPRFRLEPRERELDEPPLLRLDPVERPEDELPLPEPFCGVCECSRS